MLELVSMIDFICYPIFDMIGSFGEGIEGRFTLRLEFWEVVIFSTGFTMLTYVGVLNWRENLPASGKMMNSLKPS